MRDMHLQDYKILKWVTGRDYSIKAINGFYL